MKIEQLWVYPIKSCQGHPVDRVRLQKNGLEFDRNWMIVDDSGLFISQRKIAEMALIVPAIDTQNRRMTLKYKNVDAITVPLEWSQNQQKVRVWQDEVEAFKYEAEVSRWLTKVLQTESHLVRLSQLNSRMRTKSIHPAPFPVSFADSGPILLTNATSLSAVNNYSQSCFEMTRFRPNIVTAAPLPFEEEGWKNARINEISFESLYPCDRCPIVTIDQYTAKKDKGAFSSLANYRKAHDLSQEVIFGMRMIPSNEGVLKTGDTLHAN